MNPTPTAPAKPPRYLKVAGIGLLLAAFIMLGLPYILHQFDEGAGGFGLERLNVLALAALLVVATLHIGFTAYRLLFPRFKLYQQESLEGDGKLFENLTDELRKPLWKEDNIYPNRLAQLAERRKVNTLQFIMRCVRVAFCLLVLFGVLHLVEHALTLATLAAPGVPLSSLPQ